MDLLDERQQRHEAAEQRRYTKLFLEMSGEGVVIEFMEQQELQPGQWCQIEIGGKKYEIRRLS